MIRHMDNHSESWRNLPWKQFRRDLFRLQKRVYKAIQVRDNRKAKSLMKLILKSTAARLLAVRQVTQLNTGKKTAGVDGKASLSFEERFAPRNSLVHIETRAHRVFNKETKQNNESSKKLLDRAFPSVPYSENKHVNVKGGKSPYDGDITYWSERNSKLYDGTTSQASKRQDHTCGYCGLKLLSDERVHLHHVDGNHNNWKKNNLLAVHESCHDYIHMSKSESQEHREPDAGKPARPVLTERGEG